MVILRIIGEQRWLETIIHIIWFSDQIVARHLFRTRLLFRYCWNCLKFVFVDFFNFDLLVAFNRLFRCSPALRSAQEVFSEFFPSTARFDLTWPAGSPALTSGSRRSVSVVKISSPSWVERYHPFRPAAPRGAHARKVTPSLIINAKIMDATIM